MKQVVVLVAAALVVAARLWYRRSRLSRRRGAATAGPTTERGRRAPWAGRVLDAALRSDTGLVAAREVRERVRGRAFKAVTGVVLLVVAAAIVIPVATKGSSAPQQVGVVGTLTDSQRAAVARAAASAGARFRFVAEADRAAATADLKSGRIALAVTPGPELLARQTFSATDTSTTARLARAMADQLGRDAAFSTARLSPAQQALITGAKPLPVTGVEPERSKGTAQNRGTSIVGIILVFVMLSQYETWTLIGVMEEKSSRVVEVLLATVTPLQLLAGKVLGIGLVALAQAGAIVAFAFLLGAAVGSSLLHGAAPLTLVAALVWLVVGYAFYCWVYAAAGSMAERQDQVQTLVLPLSIPMIVGYVLAIATASSGQASLFVQVLAYLPPTAPFIMPVLVGLRAVSWWGFAASVVISIVCTVGLARLAAQVYRRAVLRTGRRVRLRDVLG